MLKILSTNISEKKGTVKIPADEIILNEFGVVNDAHSGAWHRQVSMLGIESVRRFEQQSKRQIRFGEFAENITTEGMELYETFPLDRFTFGDVELEVTQIGKACHGHGCAIYTEVGACVMPKEGIFCRVLHPGTLQAGDEGVYVPKVFRSLVITLSDRASSGEYEDRSGPSIEKSLSRYFETIKRQAETERVLMPDDGEKLTEVLRSSHEKFDFIFTTGGTGIGQRDITPEVVKPMLDKEIPGIMEMIRVKYGAEKPNALLSRGVAGLLGNCFVFTLPGSVRAVEEYMQELTRNLVHLVYMRYALDAH
jgi:molybdopterin adenylyltransferase